MNKTIIAKFIVSTLITFPLGILIGYKFGETANIIYWGSIMLGSIIQQIIWNFWDE
mgnify:CR=1 FL=1